MNGKFRFHGVGQGLFYSGILYAGSDECFSFVYDCGGKKTPHLKKNPSPLIGNICNFKKFLRDENGTKQLDLLVISHLHADHINGLSELLKDVTVGTVVMPYMAEDLRLMARITAEGRVNAADEALYIAPEEFFGKKVKIIYIVGNDPKNNVRERWHEEISEELPHNATVYGKPVYEGNKKIGYESGAKIEYREKWRFEFENLSVDNDAALKQFTSDVNDFKTTNNINSLADIFRQNKTQYQTFINALTGIFQKLFKSSNASKAGCQMTVNRSSLIMNHFPVGGSHRLAHCCACCDCCIPQVCCHLGRECQNVGKKTATLLTGDMELNKSDKLCISRDNVSILQIPHHGGNIGDNPGFWTNIDPKPHKSVISFGWGNGYGHPKEDTVKEFANKSHTIVPVTQANGFSYVLKNEKCEECKECQYQKHLHLLPEGNGSDFSI